MTFIGDLNERLSNRIQSSSDGLAAYVEAVKAAFGADVDYGDAVKFHDAELAGARKYSPPKVVRAERTALSGGTRRQAHFDHHRKAKPRDADEHDQQIFKPYLNSKRGLLPVTY
jgi:hypothetical protein